MDTVYLSTPIAKWCEHCAAAGRGRDPSSAGESENYSVTHGPARPEEPADPPCGLRRSGAAAAGLVACCEMRHIDPQYIRPGKLDEAPTGSGSSGFTGKRCWTEDLDPARAIDRRAVVHLYGEERPHDALGGFTETSDLSRVEKRNQVYFQTCLLDRGALRRAPGPRTGEFHVAQDSSHMFAVRRYPLLVCRGRDLLCRPDRGE